MSSPPEYQLPQGEPNDPDGDPEISVAASEPVPLVPQEPWFPSLAPTPSPAQIEPRDPPRIPHLGHLLFLLLAIAPIGLLATGLLMGVAMHEHVFGVSTAQQAIGNVHYILGSEGFLYLVTFALALLIFPAFWHKPLLAGLQWNGKTALRLRYWLFSAAVICFLLALFSGQFFQGPTNTPIEKIFHSPGAAWLLFGFGITFAPFFEEMFFRGFLLPSLCTAADWIAEKVDPNGPLFVGWNGRPHWPRNGVATAAVSLLSIPTVFLLAFYIKDGHYALEIVLPYLALLIPFFTILALRKSPPHDLARPVAADGHPEWSMAAMVIGSLMTSIPFAAMHAEQTGYAVGPFFLLVGVSIVLCAVRLSTRSLASSVLVHSCYNFLLFSVMLVASDGFRHVDKM
jgi:hypothetical protein